MEGFDDAFYQAHYSLPDHQLGPPAYSNAHHHHPSPLMSYPSSDHFPPGSFVYPPPHASSDLLAGGIPATFPSHPDDFSFQPPVHHGLHASSHAASLGSHLSHAMHAYDPLSAPAHSMPMGLDRTNPFPYDATAFGTSIGPLDPTLEQHSVPPHAHLPSQTIHLDPGAAYAVAQAPEPIDNTYWNQHTAHDVTVQAQSTGPIPGPSGDFSHASGPSQEQSLPQSQPPEFQPYAQPANPAVPHRYIQPKRSSPVKGAFAPQAKVEAGNDSPYASIYSNSGFDIMGVLAQVVSRPDPKINIGAVDLSCAFVLCDITLEDHPIVYVSEAFERLTGYTNQEIVGQNCRFLQGPDGMVQRGMQRKFVDQNTAYRLRSTIEERTEIQASILNYRKGGQPFVNLITMIPIRWGGSDYRFYVGFQVDLVETPDAVTRRNPNGTYMINYQRNQLPNYVVPPDVYRTNPDLVTLFDPGQVSAVLESLEGPGPSYRHYLNRVLVENMDDIIHVLSFEGEFLYLSPSCLKVLEYEPAELVGKGLSTVCHPSDIGSVIRDLRARITTEPVSVVYRIRKKYSGYIWFESHGSWHITDRGRQFMVLGGRARAVYNFDDIATVGRGGLAENDIWAKLSMSGIVLFISARARPVLGRVSDDLIGKSIQDLTGPDTRAQVMEALAAARSGQQVSFTHKVRHKKGHMLPVQTTLIPGDSKEGEQPSFLVAQLRFHRPLPSVGAEEPGSSTTETGLVIHGSRDATGSGQAASGLSGVAGTSRLPAGNQDGVSLRDRSLFTELAPTRGSSWQFELRELERQNGLLAEEVHRLLTRRKKRKRKQSTIMVEKICAMCRTKSTPEWRRGPSGNRDLCNSCGLRWAKQVRNGTQPTARRRRA
ncbi:GATA transcription factor LreA [Aspergillus sclerotioniger CBS 115572]|uniref:GATA transcription factor LreA n=1 Tax=Aspergillus sclerotioniger CBS 115572 TaxID=1450535 RepID=A0A317W5D1_9EURO|nr:GATA transcription factor LreA [Aspergillus sclerotioniger CBS 115572]PWY79350.1 GATA transcription factor LreA [Aspergillus sclerotioniger CBS 115572]